MSVAAVNEAPAGEALDPPAPSSRVPYVGRQWDAPTRVHLSLVPITVGSEALCGALVVPMLGPDSGDDDRPPAGPALALIMANSSRCDSCAERFAGVE